jgi:crossover junction endodeoxyribonuclease RuvC
MSHRDDRPAVLGIDPGLDGGVALIRPDGSIRLHATPVLHAGAGSRRNYDVAQMVALLSAEPVGLAVIEAVAARPGQGVASMLRFGYGFGLWIGLLGALAIPFERVLSQARKRAILAGTGRDKAAAIAYCARRFPAASLLATPRATRPHDGLADAICLAEWGRRLLAGSVAGLRA